MDASKKFFKRANPFHLVMTFILSFFSHFCGLSNCQSTPVSRQSPIQVVTEPDVEQLVDHYTTPPPPAVLGLHGNLSVIVIIVNYQIVPFRAKRHGYTIPFPESAIQHDVWRGRGGLWTSRLDYLANITGQFNIVHSFPSGHIIHHSQVPISSPRAQLIDRPSVVPRCLSAAEPESPTRLSRSAERRQYYDGDRWCLGGPRRRSSMCVCVVWGVALTDRSMMVNRQRRRISRYNLWTFGHHSH